MNKKIIFSIAIIIFIITGASMYTLLNKKLLPPDASVTNFKECVEAGYPVTKSIPSACWVSDNQYFTETTEQTNIPKTGPVTITGEISCLPKKGPIQTMECAFGLKDVNNNYYTLNNLSQFDPNYELSTG